MPVQRCTWSKFNFYVFQGSVAKLNGNHSSSPANCLFPSHSSGTYNLRKALYIYHSRQLCFTCTLKYTEEPTYGIPKT